MKHRLSSSVGMCLLTVLLPLALWISAAAEGGPHPWTDKPVLESPEDFHFIIIADNTGGARPGVLADGITKANLLRPAFVMTIGDLIEGYKDNEADIEAEWRELFGIIEPLDMRLYFIQGNHEASSALMAEDFERRFGRPYYHFVYRNVLFLCLNSQDGVYEGWRYPRAISDEQVEYVRRVLEENRDVRWTFVFLHQPLWDKHGYDDPGWDKVQRLLSARPHMAFAGHYHRYGKHEIEGNAYIRLATTGGATALHGAEQGEFDHITWVTVTDDGPAIVNLALDGIHRDDVSIDLSERAYWSVNWRWPVLAFPVVTEVPTVTRVPISVHFTNITDVPMTAKATVTPEGQLKVRPDTIEVALEPGGEKTVEAMVESPEPVAVGNVGQILVDWEVAYPIPGRETVKGRRTQKVMVEPIHETARMETDVSIDGDLSEWTALPFSVDEPAEISRDHRKPWYGPDDASFRFGVARDDEYLYIAVEAVDDHFHLSEGQPFWRCDGLSVIIDPRERSARSEGDDGRTLSIEAGPGGCEGPTGVVVASVRTETGYNAEIAVPLLLLVEKRGGEVADFRLNLSMRDREDAAGPSTRVWWRPDWGDPYNYVDSGTFRLE